MKGRVGPWLLWSRALVLGGLATGLGTVGHLTAGGRLPGPGTMVTLSVVMVALSALLVVRPASRWRLVAALAAGQAVVHLVLSATAGHQGDASHMHMSEGAHEAAGSLVDHLMAHTTGNVSMMAAHLAAAALLGLWLAVGEEALWTLIALAVRRVVAALPGLAVLEVRPRDLTTPTPGPLGPRSPWQVRPHARRGPPLATAS